MTQRLQRQLAPWQVHSGPQAQSVGLLWHPHVHAAPMQGSQAQFASVFMSISPISV